jgi:hypothetical protein
MLDGKMHQTTVRFSPDLWAALEVECRALGVSVAQYLREAAVARLVYAAGRAGDIAYDRAFETVGASESAAKATVSQASETNLSALAVSAQGAQVRKRAREVRAESAELRRQRSQGGKGNRSEGRDEVMAATTRRPDRSA